MYVKVYKIRETNKGARKPYVLFASEKFRMTVKQVSGGVLEELLSGGPYVIGIDGSGASTGVFLFGLSKDNQKKVPLYALNLTRSSNETFVEYRICYKRLFRKLLQTCKVTRLYYEEPVVEYFSAVPVLYSLRTVLEEILIEDGDSLKMQTKLYYVPNATWKKWMRVLAGDKAAEYSDDAKAFARELFLDNVEICLDDREPALAMDITDAFALGFASAPAYAGMKEAMVYESPVGQKLSD